MKKIFKVASVMVAMAVMSLPLMAQNVPIYPTGNVLAVGVWNTSNGSSDVGINVELTDNNGVVYVDGALGPATGSSSLTWKPVFFY